MPTLRALECLVEAVDRGSVTAAAAALHLSQPALSHQLAALEREVGAPLVERLPRGVRATAAGVAVVEQARVALAAARRSVALGRAVAEGAGGGLRVACAETMVAPLLAPVLRAWRLARPGVALSVVECRGARAVADLLTAQEADLGLAPRPERFDGRVTVVGEEEVVAVLPPDLDPGPALAWADLDGLDVVHFHPDNGLAAWLDEAAAAHGTTLTAVTRTRSATTAVHLAHAGLGVALVPTTALPPAARVAVRPLRPRLTRQVVVLDPAPSDALARRFTADLVSRGVPVPAAARRP
ncbi:LysR family transcriptional regulator [Actinokineospora bangkokensis]|uniref:LysR family transcriptional regulator n=1 Tax=Actinokineospora bangkokensis TaxID=1193682 RepID=A0A1Q9LPQ5_9PSEU|nr:LysR family transcriptional regulator [Actinokineospora bangkokensis]OLR94005.1 LysR family transcriptional regulator [Actinokineospora bangkokensis]